MFGNKMLHGALNPFPTYGGLISRSNASRNVRVEQLEKIIADNGLERMSGESISISVFGALCNALGLPQHQERELVRKVKDHAQELVAHGRLTLRLKELSDRQLLNSFCGNPYKEEFAKFVFDVVSLAYRVKVVVCSVSAHATTLSETYYSNKFKHEIRVLEISSAHFEALHKKGTRAMTVKELQAAALAEVFDEDPVPGMDGVAEYPRKHRRSMSDQNFESMFGGERPGSHKGGDQNNSSDSLGHSEGQADQSERNHDQDLNVLKYLDDKNDLDEEYAAGATGEEQAVGMHVEKKLDNIFKQEVPLGSLFADPDSSLHATGGESTSAGLFGNESDLHLNLVKDTTQEKLGVPEKLPQQPQGVEGPMGQVLNPMGAGAFYPAMDSGAFLFPFNMGQMAFQAGEPNFPLPPQLADVPKKKPIIINQTPERFAGKLKFFDEVKGYGFIVKDDDEKDIFCHYDDFCKAGINLNMLRAVKMGQVLRLSFCCLNYIGRHNKSKKAVDLMFISLTPNPTLASMASLVSLGSYPVFNPLAVLNPMAQFGPM